MESASEIMPPRRILQCPQLPPEVWSTVLSNVAYGGTLPDDAFLWTTCRAVSKTFQNETERIFRTRRLPETKITFRLHKFHANFGYEDETPEVYAAFDRVSQDGNTAYFLITEQEPLDEMDWEIRGPDGRARVWYRDFFKQMAAEYFPAPDSLQDRQDMGADAIGKVFYSITVGATENDTELPNLTVDDNIREVSFDWRGMYTNLFGEARYASSLMPPGHSAEEALARIDRRMQDGVVYTWAKLRKMEAGVVMGEAEAYLRAFARRVEGYYKEHHDMTGYIYGDRPKGDCTALKDVVGFDPMKFCGAWPQRTRFVKRVLWAFAKQKGLVQG